MPDHKPTGLGEDLIQKSAEFFRIGQRRSLLWTITSWLEASPNPTPCFLVTPETFFPRTAELEPKVAKFLPEVYACIDQLLMALTHCAAQLHLAAGTYEDEPVEKNRTVAVGEIIKCIATHVHAIRVLSLTGFDVQVRQIVRTYIEYLELLALVCADTAALDDFIASSDKDENNAFWHRYLSKSKARKKRYFNSVLKSGLEAEDLDRDREWHGRELRLLSESAHPTVSGVTRSGKVFTDPVIVPNDHEDVTGSLMYTFSAFADTLEIPTFDYLKTKLNRLGKGGEEPQVMNRFYLIIMLAVMLGYRKDFVFWGASDLDKDLQEPEDTGERPDFR